MMKIFASYQHINLTYLLIFQLGQRCQYLCYSYRSRISHIGQLLKYTGAQGEKMVRIASNPQEGQRAHTQFRVLQHYAGDRLHAVGIKALTLMEATLKTGRTHQIRVHMQSQLCPIAGDERYGDYQINRRLHKIGLKRMFLHAAELTLAHPVSGDILQLTAPLPDELQQFLHHLSVVSGQSSQQS